MKRLEEIIKRIDGDVITIDNKEYLIKQPNLEIHITRNEESVELIKYVAKVEPLVKYKIKENEATVTVSRINEKFLDVTLRDTCIIKKGNKTLNFQECIGFCCDDKFDLIDRDTRFLGNQRANYEKIIKYFITKENMLAYYGKCNEICDLLNDRDGVES